MERIESIEVNESQWGIHEFREKMASMNSSYRSSLEPVDGVYGVSEKVLDNGDIVRTGKNELCHSYREYYHEGQIFKRYDFLGNHQTMTTNYDDNGIAYSKTIRYSSENKAKIIETSLSPDATIVKSNFTALTDSNGRLISAKLSDVKINNASRPNTGRYRDNSVYLPTDEVGHMMGHHLGGPTGLENTVAQNQYVNRSAFKRVENEVKSLVDQGGKVDYEMKANYIGSSKRPSSFEPRITVDGKDYDLPDDLKKIYNTPDPTPVRKAMTDIGETVGSAHETGIKSGLVAAGITLAVSTVDNVSSFVDGEITAEEMVTDIVTETAAAGAIEYGSELISAGVSQAMSKSSSALVQKVAGTCAPAAVVSFAVESYDSVSAFAKGEIDGSELAYELGENAASVAGAIKGQATGAAVGLAVGGPVGAVAGGIVGGVVGAAVASEMYATAVEVAAEGIEQLAETAEGLMQDTVELFTEHIPEKLEEVKTAFTDFVTEFDLPFHI